MIPTLVMEHQTQENFSKKSNIIKQLAVNDRFKFDMVDNLL